MSCCVPPRRPVLPVDREAWREARDARRKVLDAVRARRRIVAERERAAKRGENPDREREEGQ